ncbi:MAG: xanthine dehydrogenase accessory protein XdhC [Devosia sp.]
MMRSGELDAFLSDYPRAIVAELASVRGSSPREAGTFMVIAPDALLGTIGGGALEHMVIDRARRALRGMVDVALGPEIGQCCGGRAVVMLRVVLRPERDRLIARLLASEALRPDVFVFGSGHVGRALTRALAALPLQVHVIDTRPGELHDLPDGVDARSVPMPEAVVRSAPEGSSYVILTHDHALDFLIAAEALKRVDAPYIGMVGSKTKRAKLRSWYLSEAGGTDGMLRRLVLPIGDFGLVDKRPEVIAALAAAEIMVQIGRREVSVERAPETVEAGADLV